MSIDNTGDESPPSFDWRGVARTALGSAVLAGIIGGALHALGKMIEAEAEAAVDELRDSAATPSEEQHPIDEEPEEQSVDFEPMVSREELSAAMTLGVSLDASEDEIRAALRARLADSRLHPDQGGDGDEAKELIAAKNLLVERARAARL